MQFSAQLDDEFLMRKKLIAPVSTLWKCNCRFCINHGTPFFLRELQNPNLTSVILKKKWVRWASNILTWFFTVLLCSAILKWLILALRKELWGSSILTISRTSLWFFLLAPASHYHFHPTSCLSRPFKTHPPKYPQNHLLSLAQNINR